MRYQGKITSWNDVRGFGFIEWNGGNGKAFVHVSSLNNKQQRAAVGDIVTYEVRKDEQGRHRAEKVAFLTKASRKTVNRPTSTFPWRPAVAVVLVAAVGVGAYFRHKPQLAFAGQAFSAQPQEAVTATSRCETKTQCSQMTSCDEATFYLNNCPGTEMDGDGDGVPCESQWCSF